ncbi:SIR2 family protein [Salmonella enterica]|nr:hypothetical protein [Salmonella enterica subsp. enterica serovar Uppsala]ECL4489552.1 hypothetical protein [Salmonella enterica subsp. enterica]
MSSITYLKYNDPNTTSFLATAFSENSLIPIIGAGFTRGCLTSSNKRVPSGNEFKAIMINIIKTQKGYVDESVIKKLEAKTFSEISELFFNENWVPRSEVIRCLENYFSGVTLTQDKKDFLKCISWPYIYTLNADNGIEKHSEYKVALPYDDALSFDSKKYPTLYKIHGDVEYEMRHDVSRLVFRKSDYLSSLESNRKMLELLQIDFREKNIIYIGCSLSDEIDLAFLVAKQSQSGRKSTKNIIFLEKKPEDELDEQDYIDMGINMIILYDKGEYQQIYETINSAYQLSAKKTNELNEFKLSISKLDNNKENNENFLVKGIVDISNESLNSNFLIPYYYTERSIQKDIIEATQNYDVVIIKGTRISGRTLLALNVLNNIKDKEILIIDSSKKISEQSINKILGQENSIIFFDSSALDYDVLKKINKSCERFEKSKITVLICVDANDNHEDTFWRTKGRVKVFNVKNTFNAKEQSILNNRAIGCQLPTFSDGKYILDKIYNVYKVIGEDKLISKIPASIELYFILCIIATKHSVTGQELIMSGLEDQKFQKVIKDNSPFLEIERISAQEQYDHTSYKVVSYASSWVVSVIREFYRTKSKDWCVDNLINFLKTIYFRDKKLAIAIRKYDNLNHIFSSGTNGAAELIIDLYNKLQAIEGKEAEFYVQKAKAYYNISRSNTETKIKEINERIRELDTALTWARTEKNIATERNILHIRALLWIKKIVIAEVFNKDDIEISLQRVIEAINNNNDSYNNTLLNSSSKSSKNLRKYIGIIDENIGKLPFILTMQQQWADIKRSATQ